MQINDQMWNQVRQYYKDKFGMEPELVELMADIDVLKLCCSGSSNKTIANYLNLDVELVSNIIDKYLGFRGWISDLKFSPYAIFSRLINSDLGDGGISLRDAFIVELDLGLFWYNGTNDTINVDLLLSICHSMYHYERSLNEGWV